MNKTRVRRQTKNDIVSVTKKRRMNADKTRLFYILILTFVLGCKCDVVKQTFNHHQEVKISEDSQSYPPYTTSDKRVKSRHLLDDYSEYGEWKDEEALLNYDEDEGDLTLTQKLARNWKKVAIRSIFLLSFIFLILLCCRCWLATTCPFILSCLSRVCCCWTDICCKSCKTDKDPIYERVKELAKNLGIELNEETYDHLLKMCEDQGMSGVQHIRRK